MLSLLRESSLQDGAPFETIMCELDGGSILTRLCFAECLSVLPAARARLDWKYSR